MRDLLANALYLATAKGPGSPRVAVKETMAKAPSKKPKPVGDRTRTARAAAHLERLGDAEGKRVVVDLGKADREALEGLQAAGYAESQSGVIRRAIQDAAARQPKSP